MTGNLDITAVMLATSIRELEREAFDVALANADFLIERVPAGPVRDQLLARRERLVNDFTAALLAQRPAA